MTGNTRLIILSVCFGAFISCLDSYIVNISLPEIATAFTTDIGSVSGVTIAYLLLMTCTMLVWGKGADRFGARRLYLAGFVLFTLGSLLCGLAHSLEMLVFSRCVQGFGGAAMFAIGMTVIALYVPPEMMGKAYGLVAATAAMGLTLGAPLGGLITGLFSWRGVFLINVPLGCLAWIISQRAIPGTPEGNEIGAKFDVLGALLSSASLFALVWGLALCERDGWRSPGFLTFTGIAIILGGLFVFQERRHSNPLINPAIFEDRGFSLCVGVGMILMMVWGGVGLVIPFHLIWSKGLSVESAGLVMALNAIVGAVFNPFTGALADRKGAARLCLTSMGLSCLVALYFAFMAQEPGVSSAVVLLLGLGLASSLYFPGANALIMQLAPQAHKGAASGFNATARTLGMTMGASIFAVLLPGHGEAGQLSENAMFVPWLFGAAVLGVAFFMCIPLVQDERRKKREEKSP